jgi:hypothetical protein
VVTGRHEKTVNNINYKSIRHIILQSMQRETIDEMTSEMVRHHTVGLAWKRIIYCWGNAIKNWRTKICNVFFLT